MAKKKKKTCFQPTTNKFWSKIGKNGQQLSMQSNISNMDNQSDLKDLTQDTSPANPMTELSASTSSVPGNNQDQPNNLKSTLPKGPKIYYMKTYKEEEEEGTTVVKGTASDIKLVIKTPNKTDTLQTDSVSAAKPGRGKPIQSRITRGPLITIPPKQSPINIPQPKFAPTQSNPFLESLGNLLSPYPKGIPRSFLVRPSAETPEPYSTFVVPKNPIAPTLPNVNQTVLDPNRMQNIPIQTSNWQTSTGTFVQTFENVNASASLPIPVTENPMEARQTYSPSDIYDENFFTGGPDDPDEELDSPEVQSGQKRQSAFERLGPLAEQPKKPKLTINLLCNSEQSVREVVNETQENVEKKIKYVPFHLRQDIQTSTDETVMKYLIFWPWKKNVAIRKSVTARNSKSVMILEREQMEEQYDKENLFFQITVKGYPPTWTKEMVLDTILETLKGKSFIPCFIEFSPTSCKFLVIRNSVALVAIHKIGFFIRKDDVEISLTISSTDISLSHLDFIPRLVLRKRLSMVYNGENSLDLSGFTMKEDLSHFIYFPLNQTANQSDIVHMQSSVAWMYITELNLSHNKITTLEGFRLEKTVPKLKHLDLSFNYIQQITSLIRCRSLSLRSIKLEGNPLCNDFIDPEYYVKVLKTMFSTLMEIDGVKIQLKGEMPTFKKNYCPEDAKGIIDRFLEVYFPLLDSTTDHKAGIRDMYHENACMTVTFKYKLRYDPIYRSFRSLFNRSRVLEEGDTDATDGAAEISKLINKWPALKHDPETFTVDVLLHEEFLTIFKVCGVVKLTAETLAEDEHLLAFSRTFALRSDDGWEYKIINEMVYWDFPTPECISNAFRVTTVKPKTLSTELELPPDEDLKKKLLDIFMQVTNVNKNASERCLELKNWNLKIALDHFMKLLKLDDLDTLFKEVQ